MARRSFAALAFALAASAAAAPGAAVFSIDAFGAVAGADTHAAALANGAALAAAIAAANATGAAASVLVPAASTYAFLPAAPFLSGLVNLTILLEGELALFTSNFSEWWPGYAAREPWMPLRFADCAGLRIVSQGGAGRVSGRGTQWWWSTILGGRDIRPRAVLEVDGAAGLEVANITLTNAPMFHVNVVASTGVLVQGVTVLVDLEDQVAVYRYIAALEEGEGEAAAKRDRFSRVLRAASRIGPTAPEHEAEAEALARRSPAQVRAARRALLPAHFSAARHSWFDEAWRIDPPFPMIYALNTDGIDVAGVGIVVRNCSVTNFDDTVCAKPQLNCTRDLLVEDILVTWGCGLSMGSVPPDEGNNCISGVLVRNVTFESPMKAVYVKPNPQKPDSLARGEISNVTYQDMLVNEPLWWPVWFGTQQQHQPGYNGTGCVGTQSRPPCACTVRLARCFRCARTNRTFEHSSTRAELLVSTGQHDVSDGPAGERL